MPGTVINSLVNPRSTLSADRRLVADATATNGPPLEPEDGAHTRGHRWLHIMTTVGVGGTADWRLWVFCEMSQTWNLDTQLGAGGTVSISFAAPGPNTWNVREIAGIERVYVEVLNQAGGASVDVWAGSIGGFGASDG